MPFTKSLTTLATLAALAGMTGPVLAAPICATDNDMAAFRTAAVQQQLMVAALTCHDIDAYNRFVVMYRPELQKSDAELKAFFVKKGSEAEYDTFKTKLANLSSLSNIANGPAYCANAGAAFDMALRSHQPLASFVADQRLMIALPQQNRCTARPTQASIAPPMQAAAAAPPARLGAPAKPPVRIARAMPPAQPAVPAELSGVPSHDLPATPFGAVPEQSYRDYDEAPPTARDERQAFNDQRFYDRFDDDVAPDYRTRNDYDEQDDAPPPPRNYRPRAAYGDPYDRYQPPPQQSYPYWWPRNYAPRWFGN